MNKMYKTLEEATRELGIDVKVEYPTFDIKWETLSNEGLVVLYNHYYKYVQEVEKQADDRKSDKRQEALAIYDRVTDLLTEIIDEIAYRAGVDDEWENESYRVNISAWDAFVKKHLQKLDK